MRKRRVQAHPLKLQRHRPTPQKQLHPRSQPPKKIVAVTACPTGIAHTYMAADALKYAAEDLGYDFKVETQGSSGNETLTPGRY